MKRCGDGRTPPEWGLTYWVVDGVCGLRGWRGVALCPPAAVASSSAEKSPPSREMRNGSRRRSIRQRLLSEILPIWYFHDISEGRP